MSHLVEHAGDDLDEYDMDQDKFMPGMCEYNMDQDKFIPVMCEYDMDQDANSCLV